VESIVDHFSYFLTTAIKHAITSVKYSPRYNSTWRISNFRNVWYSNVCSFSHRTNREYAIVKFANNIENYELQAS